jgi:hypothetical protein
MLWKRRLTRPSRHLLLKHLPLKRSPKPDRLKPAFRLVDPSEDRRAQLLRPAVSRREFSKL